MSPEPAAHDPQRCRKLACWCKVRKPSAGLAAKAVVGLAAALGRVMATASGAAVGLPTPPGSQASIPGTPYHDPAKPSRPYPVEAIESSIPEAKHNRVAKHEAKHAHEAKHEWARFGQSGGKARAGKLTPGERVEIAKRAAMARWRRKD